MHVFFACVWWLWSLCVSGTDCCDLGLPPAPWNKVIDLGARITETEADSRGFLWLYWFIILFLLLLYVPMSILCLFYVPTSGIYNNGTLNFFLPSCILCSLLAISYVFLMFLLIFLCSGGPHACRQKFSSLLLFCASTCLQKKPWILNKRRKPNLLTWPTACFQLLFFLDT